jgi:hypothetical protein
LGFIFRTHLSSQNIICERLRNQSKPSGCPKVNKKIGFFSRGCEKPIFGCAKTDARGMGPFA